MPEIDAVQAQLARLQRKYALALPEKVAALEAACAASFAAPGSEEIRTTAYRQAHSLAGSSGTYGFLDLGAAARSIEALIPPSSTPDASRTARIQELLVTLRTMASAAAAGVPA